MVITVLSGDSYLVSLSKSSQLSWEGRGERFNASIYYTLSVLRIGTLWWLGGQPECFHYRVTIPCLVYMYSYTAQRSSRCELRVHDVLFEQSALHSTRRAHLTSERWAECQNLDTSASTGSLLFMGYFRAFQEFAVVGDFLPFSGNI